MSAPRMVAVATILVVDDEPRIVQLVRDYLEHGGFTVLTASDGQAALRTARTGRPDLVVLDLSLPGLDGLDVARSLRREGEVPIIMLTARTVELDVPRMEARFGGKRLDLTKSEFQIVAAMARQPGRVFTRAQLLDAVRGVAFESYERAIDAHIKNIRRKVGAQYIETVFGVGYRFAEPK